MRWVDRLWVASRPTRAALSAVETVDRDVALLTEGRWSLHGRLWSPIGPGAPRPALLVVPGLGQDTDALEAWRGPVQLRELAQLGLVVLGIDLSGRGRSWGTDVYGGPEHHADVRTGLRELADHPEVDPQRIGVLSLSFGAVAVAGALATRDRPDTAWWIDWEGPSDREIITAGGKRMAPALGHSLDDDRYWFPREPVRWVGAAQTPYLRYQSRVDHAQPGELRHADRMMRAALAGGGNAQLNDHGVGDLPAAPTWAPPGLRAARRWIHERLRHHARLP